MVINYINPKGISLVREETKLDWADDSLLFQENSDRTFPKVDSIQSNSMIYEKSSSEDTQKTIGVIEKNQVISENKVNKEETTSNTNEKSESTIPKAIKLEQAYSLFSKGVLFIDARDVADYSVGHIASAINIPFDDFDNYKENLETIPKEKPVVVYCAGTECDLSILLGNLLYEQGYEKIYIFFGGWGEWLDANYPVEHPSKTDLE